MKKLHSYLLLLLSWSAATPLSAQCQRGFTYSIVDDCQQQVEVRASNPAPHHVYAFDFGDGSKQKKGKVVRYEYYAVGEGVARFQINLYVTDTLNHCRDTSSQWVQFKERPDAEFQVLDDPDDDLPLADCNDLSDLVEILYAPKTKIVKGTLSWGDGSPKISFRSGQLPLALSHTYTKTGSSIIRMEVEGVNGCKQTIIQKYFKGVNPAVGIAKPPTPYTSCGKYRSVVYIRGTEGNSVGTDYELIYNHGKRIKYAHPPPDSVVLYLDRSSCGLHSKTGKSDIFDVTIKTTNPCGESVAAMEILHLNMPPIARIIDQTPKNCVGNVFTFCDQSDYSYYIRNKGCVNKPMPGRWKIESNLPYKVVGSGLNQSCVDVIFEEEGTARVWLFTKNRCGEDSTSIDVKVMGEARAGYRWNKQGNVHCSPFTVKVESHAENFNVLEYHLNPQIGWRFIKGSHSKSTQPFILFTIPGKFTLTQTVYNGCTSARYSEEIVIADLPQVEIEPLPSPCQTTLTTTPVSNIQNQYSNLSNIIWTYEGADLQEHRGEISPSITFQGPNNKIVLRATNECGTASDSIEFHTAEEFDIELDSSLAVCKSNDCINIPVSPTGGYWTGDVQRDGEFCPKDFEAGKSYTGTYIFKRRGCLFQKSISISLFHPLKMPVFNDTSVCINSAPFSLPKVLEHAEWSGSGFDVKEMFDPAAAGVGRHRIILTVTDPVNQCQSNASMNIDVVGNPIIKIPSQLILCRENAKIRLDSLLQLKTSNPTISYWEGQGFQIQDGVFDCSQALGSYWLVYHEKRLAGCESSDSLLVVLKAASEIQIESDTLLCKSNENHIFLASPKGGEWTGLNPDAPPIGRSNGQIQLDRTGRFTYRYQYINESGCISQKEISININDLPELPIEDSIELHICRQGNAIALVPNSGYFFHWEHPSIYLDANQVWKIQDDALLDGENTLRYTLTDTINQCSNSGIIRLILYPSLSLKFNIPDKICVHSEAIFRYFYDPTLRLQWNFGNGSTSTKFKSVNVYHYPGRYTVTAVISRYHPADSSLLLCQQTITKEIEVISLPTFEKLEINIEAGQSPTLKLINSSSSHSTYHEKWTLLQTPQGRTKYHGLLTTSNACGSNTLELLIPTCDTEETAIDSTGFRKDTLNREPSKNGGQQSKKRSLKKRKRKKMKNPRVWTWQCLFKQPKRRWGCYWD